MRRGSRHGLTLVELLAAAVILSAISAAGVSIVRDSAAAAERALSLQLARAALERWDRETDWATDADKARDWRWLDQAGRTWRVRVEQDTTPAATSAGAVFPESRRDESDSLKVSAWAAVIERSGHDGATFTEVWRSWRLSPAELATEDAPGPGEAPQ